ncbi:MAG: hypothetical protein FJW34_00175 [Acidobacteria bacterium]|nr:hypothetical protein [Acidobacteriota bacterium]
MLHTRRDLFALFLGAAARPAVWFHANREFHCQTYGLGFSLSKRWCVKNPVLGEVCMQLAPQMNRTIEAMALEVIGCATPAARGSV